MFSFVSLFLSLVLFLLICGQLKTRKLMRFHKTIESFCEHKSDFSFLFSCVWFSYFFWLFLMCSQSFGMEFLSVQTIIIKKKNSADNGFTVRFTFMPAYCLWDVTVATQSKWEIFSPKTMIKFRKRMRYWTKVKVSQTQQQNSY